MYIKMPDWKDSDDSPDLKVNYPYKRTIEIYCNKECKEKLTEDVILEVAVDNILDYFDEQNFGGLT
jgi:hypothetical protein